VRFRINLRSAETPVDALVAITTITPAVAGTENVPAGSNGSFTFTVTLSQGATTLTTTATAGVIVAIPHASTPVKRIELLLLGDLRVRTGNVITGDLTLVLSGTNADVFIMETLHATSLPAGGEADITLTPRANLAVDTYTATLTVSGEGLTETVAITYTVIPAGIDSPQSVKPLKAWRQNGQLHVSGLTVGKQWAVYGISGLLICQQVANSDEADVNLPGRGVYIVTSDNAAVKVMY
jgi:hypothetical protein